VTKRHAKLVLDSPRGPFTLRVEWEPTAGLECVLTRFGGDGWNERGEVWSEQMDGETQPLAEFVSTHTELPPEEAVALTEGLLADWHARGWDELARRDERSFKILFAAVVAAGVLALIGAGYIVALAIRFLT
jgi:hypothetical protein